MKKLLFSTMLVTSMVGGFSQILWAKTLQGESDWLIKKVAADTPYCTMARQFEANAVLTLAQNARGEGTVALDFQRNAFDVTRPYPVILSVGGITREYAVKPAVPNVVIMRIGNDSSLFEAMRNNDVLNVTIDNEEFSLDLKGYDFARSNMNTCLGVPQAQSMTVLEQTNAPAVAAPSVPQVSIQQNDRIDALLAENKRLTQELMARDRQQQQILQRTDEVSSVEKNQLIQKLTLSEQKNAQLAAQLEQMEADLIASRRSLNPDMSLAMQQKDSQITELVRQNQALKVSLEQTKAQMTSLMQANQDSIAMREELAQLESQAAAYKAERDEYKRQLSSEATSTSQEVVTLRERVAELQSRIEASNAEIMRYEQQLQSAATSADGQVAVLRSQMKQMEDQIAAYQAEQQRYKAELAQASTSSTHESAALKERIATLESQIETYRSDRDRYEQQLKTAASSASQADQSLQSRMAELENQIAAYKAERDQYQAQLQEKTRQLDEIRNKEPEVIVKEVIKQVPAPLPDMAASDTEIAMRLSEAETEAQTYRAERDEYRRLLQQERLRTKTTEAPADNSNIIADMKRLEAEKAELMRQLAYIQSNSDETETAGKTDHEINDLRQRLTAAQAELAAVNNKASRLEQELVQVQSETQPSAGEGQRSDQLTDARVKDMEARLIAMTQEKARLEDELASVRASSVASEDASVANARLKDMEEQLARANSEKDALFHQLESTRSDLAAKQQKNQDYQLTVARLKDMEAQVARMTQEKSVIEGKLAEAQASGSAGQEGEQGDLAEALRKQMSALQTQVSQLNQEKMALGKQLENAKQLSDSNNPQSQVALRNAAQRVQDMEVRMKQMAQENARLQEQADIAQAKADEVTKRLAQAAVTQLAAPANVKAQQDMKAMQSEIAALEAQNAVLRKDVSHYQQNAQNRSKAPAMPAPSEAAVAMAPQAVQPIAANAARAVPLTGNEIKEIVGRARLPLVSGIDRIERVSGPDFAAFRWDTGVVYGSGEQSRMADAAAFDNSVQQYIEKTRSRCTGSFDQTIADRTVNGVRVRVADIACVDASANGVAASILFFAHNGVFYALAHEADMNTFKTAMDMRDKLASSIGATF